MSCSRGDRERLGTETFLASQLSRLIKGWLALNVMKFLIKNYYKIPID
jgi:hypothetical protein